MGNLQREIGGALVDGVMDGNTQISHIIRACKAVLAILENIEAVPPIHIEFTEPEKVHVDWEPAKLVKIRNSLLSKYSLKSKANKSKRGQPPPGITKGSKRILK